MCRVFFYIKIPSVSLDYRVIFLAVESAYDKGEKLVLPGHCDLEELFSTRATLDMSVLRRTRLKPPQAACYHNPTKREPKVQNVEKQCCFAFQRLFQSYVTIFNLFLLRQGHSPYIFQTPQCYQIPFHGQLLARFTVRAATLTAHHSVVLRSALSSGSNSYN